MRTELAGDRRLLVALSASVVLYSAGHGATALGAALLARSLVRDGSLTEAADTGLWLAPLYVGLLGALVKAGGAVVLARSEARLAGAVGNRLRGRLASAVLARGLQCAPDAALASAVTRIREVESSVSPGPVGRVRALTQLAPLALTVILLSPLLAIGGAAFAMTFGRLLTLARRSLRAACEESQVLVERGQRELDELVRNVDLWRTYGAAARVESALASAGQRAASAAVRAEGSRAAVAGANEVLGALGLLVAVVLGRELGDAVAGATLVAVVTVLMMAYRPLRDFGDSRVWVERGNLGLEALERSFPASDGNGRPRRLRSDPGHARPEWSLAPRVLEGYGTVNRGPRVELRAEAGECLAILGPTGSGKTTLLRTLLGLEPAVGRLSFGGLELTAADVGPEARPFAWVPQDAPLITATLEDNVALFAEDTENAHAALEAIGAGWLLERCGDALLGSGRRELSGGERRLVAVARALASRQPVLLLDEPTEGLDPQAAAEVVSALRRLRGSCTVLAVTHRPELAAAMDRAIHISGCG